MKAELNLNKTPFWKNEECLNSQVVVGLFKIISVALLVLGCMQLCGNVLPSQTFTWLTVGAAAASLLYYGLRTYYDPDHHEGTWYGSTTVAEAFGKTVIAAVVMSLAISTLTGNLNIQQLSIGVVSLNAFYLGMAAIDYAVRKGIEIGYKEGYNEAKFELSREIKQRRNSDAKT